jgi:uncharacterized protein YoxC
MRGWFAAAVLAVALVWLVVYVIPHVVQLLDRIQ